LAWPFVWWGNHKKMELELLQEKYPKFIYESYNWEIGGGDLTANFSFTMGNIKFNPGIIIRKVNLAQIEKIGKSEISNLIFNIGLAEIPSYWKAACPPKIVVKAGYMDKGQIKFWQDLIFNMGQFFYENELPFLKPEFEVVAQKQKIAPIQKRFSGRYLVPMGGGKDSLVTLELLRAKNKEIETFTLNANAALKKVIAVSGAKNIFVERRIDPKLVELNGQGYLNGHTPFSSILAALGVGLAALYGYKYVAISQERSSSEGNVEYLGREVNHQYSKSFAFENKFRAYSKKYLAKNIEYFSFLRPLYEIQISKIFSRYPEYRQSFLSCNKPFTISARENGQDFGWCGRCSKCLSIFAMLYPFIGKFAAEKIFGKNLFEDSELLPVMLQLCGQSGCKPFECVGTANETLAAFYLSLSNTEGAKPCLLAYFEKNILPKYPRLESQSKKIISSWNGSHNIPESLVPAVERAVLE